jgi:hypothetical protein
MNAEEATTRQWKNDDRGQAQEKEKIKVGDKHTEIEGDKSLQPH